MQNKINLTKRCIGRPVSRTGLTVVVGALTVAGALEAATPVPSWDGEEGTTHQVFRFTTDDALTNSDTASNPYGSPVATVVTGTWSDGWQDPSNPNKVAGMDPDGAWDLGTNGEIEIQVPVAAGPPEGSGTHYRVDFQVTAIAYQLSGMIEIPDFELVGLNPAEDSLTSSTEMPDSLFPAATWEGVVWSGWFDGFVGDQVSFSVMAPGQVAVVDRVEVFTRVTPIPEPSAVGLLMVTLGCLAVGRRHR